MAKYLLLQLILFFLPIYNTISAKFIRIGSKYGGWTVPSNLLNKNSICYLAGVGEDITFDLEVIKRFNCKVYSFDPTPRAVAHITDLNNKIKNKNKYKYSSNNVTVVVDKSVLSNLNFIPEGLWSKNTTMKFYEPKDPLHVSHSILNLQQTSRYFEAKCYRLKTIMQRLGHTRIDLLKLDIEGAEYEVLKSLVNDKLNIKCIAVEFDEWSGINAIKFNTDKEKKERLNKTLRTFKLLTNYGYKAYLINSYKEVLFIKQ